VDRFAHNVIEQKKWISRGDSRAANQCANALLKAFKKICNIYGDEGREALSSLFEHETRAVRSMAAAFLLRYKHEEAKAVLREIGRGKGLVALGARECINRWEEGEWELDPEPGSKESDTGG